MLLDTMLTLLRRIYEKTDVFNVEIRDALDPVHIEFDEETLEPVEDKEFPNEYDLVLKADLCHAEIQTINELLADYDNVEMRLRDGNIEIFERFPEEEANPT